MKTKLISIEVPEGKKVEWVNNVLTLVDDKPKDIMERIKTFKDALNELGRNHPLVFQYNNIDDVDSDLTAYLKLRIIVAALNEGWTPKFTEDECRYYPYFYLYTKDEVERMDEDKKKNLVAFGGFVQRDVLRPRLRVFVQRFLVLVCALRLAPCIKNKRVGRILRKAVQRVVV